MRPGGYKCACPESTPEEAETLGVGGSGQRGRGRSGGRAVSGRGRMRKRGQSGGGTLRRLSPQQGQRPSIPNGRVASARSQWPRASHCGLMHCTVKPGRYCISFSLGDRRALCRAGRGGADPISPTSETLAADGPYHRRSLQAICWRGFWRTPSVVSRKNTPIYRGTVAEGSWHIRCQPLREIGSRASPTR
jgi:hypothetical protein